MSTKKTSFQSPSIESETIESLSKKLLETNAQLSQTNKELIRVQTERADMISNISHDLRAPITAIRSAIDFLTSGQTISPEDYRTSIQLIDHRTKTLENLVQDLYYLFCVEDTSKGLDFQTLDAIPFLEEYFFDTIPDSRYDAHEMHLDLPENLHCIVTIDIQKMIRVLDNLFVNAAKYSDPGSKIILKAEYDSVAKHLIICVIDNGPGIPPEAVPHIFNRTYTVSAARTPTTATGSGLGLSIAKAIVERHGGSISCQSRLGKGSCFQIILPSGGLTI